MGEWVMFDMYYGLVCVWQVKLDGKFCGGLVVIQEIFGVNVYICEVVEGFVVKGYVVLVLFFFDLVDGLVVDFDILFYDLDGVKWGLEWVIVLGVEKVLEVVCVVVLWLVLVGRVGIVGYCWGGSIVLLVVLCLGLLLVSYYGVCNVQFFDEMVKVLVMFYFGVQDRSILLEVIKVYCEKLLQMVIFVYLVDYVFNCNVGYVYDLDSVVLVLECILDFFVEYFG